jgi:hypothetical protein
MGFGKWIRTKNKIDADEKALLLDGVNQMKEELMQDG